MNKEEIIKKGKEVVRIETNAISDLINSIDDEFVKALEILYECKGRVVLTGMGKSGLIATKDCCDLKFDRYCLNLSPSNRCLAWRSWNGQERRCCNYYISKSGETEEIANLIPMLKRLKVKLIAMASTATGILNSESNVIFF